MSKTHLGLPAEQDAGGPPGHEAPRNGYLEGPFASVAQEVTAFDLRVTGKIPRELNGRFLRVGGNPSPVDPEDPRTYNWFIGSGMVFGVRLREGRAEWYRNRFVRDDRISATMNLPRVPGPDQLSRREPYREKKGPRYVEANVTNTHGPGRVGIETLFVPMSAASAEDDGWLITSVIDMPTSTSEVLIFHAQDLLGGPVAKIHIPHRHNTGFHGNWIADAELEQTNGQPQRTRP